jgi:hypothetical protein
MYVHTDPSYRYTRALVHGCIYGCAWKDLDAMHTPWHAWDLRGHRHRAHLRVRAVAAEHGTQRHGSAPMLVLRVDRSPTGRLGQQPLQPMGFTTARTSQGSREGAPRRPRDRREWRRRAARRARPAGHTVPSGPLRRIALRKRGGLALLSAVFRFFCGVTGSSVRAACSECARDGSPRAARAPIGSGPTHFDRRVERTLIGSHVPRRLPAQPTARHVWGRVGSAEYVRVCQYNRVRNQYIANTSATRDGAPHYCPIHFYFPFINGPERAPPQAVTQYKTNGTSAA